METIGWFMSRVNMRDMSLSVCWMQACDVVATESLQGLSVCHVLVVF